MTDSRIDTLRAMAERSPDDPRFRFGLAVEYERLERWEDAARELRAYLERTEDEGNAWGRLGRVLRELGREEAARDAYRKGITAAERHGHPTMAQEFRDIVADWD